MLNSLYYAKLLRLCCSSVEEQIEFQCLFVNQSYLGDLFSSALCPFSGINSVRSSGIRGCKYDFSLLLVVLSYTVFCLHIELRRGTAFSDLPFFVKWYKMCQWPLSGSSYGTTVFKRT